MWDLLPLLQETRQIPDTHQPWAEPNQDSREFNGPAETAQLCPITVLNIRVWGHRGHLWVPENPLSQDLPGRQPSPNPTSLQPVSWISARLWLSSLAQPGQTQTEDNQDCLQLVTKVWISLLNHHTLDAPLCEGWGVSLYSSITRHQTSLSLRTSLINTCLLFLHCFSTVKPPAVCVCVCVYSGRKHDS